MSVTASGPRKIRLPDAAMGLFETGRPGGLHQRVYRSLVHAISSGRFEQGARLPSEPKLASAFDVSRPVVRQALELLRHDGLIESQRGSGNYVSSRDGGGLCLALTPVQARHFLDDLEFRLTIEPQAAFFAARRRAASDIERMATALRMFEEAHEVGAITHHFDFVFHEAIALATTNSRFVEAVRALEYGHDDARLLLRQSVYFSPRDRGVAVLREHGDVLALIRHRDGEGARDAMWRHIDGARLLLADHVARRAAPR